MARAELLTHPSAWCGCERNFQSVNGSSRSNKISVAKTQLLFNAAPTRSLKSRCVSSAKPGGYRFIESLPAWICKLEMSQRKLDNSVLAHTEAARYTQSARSGVGVTSV